MQEVLIQCRGRRHQQGRGTPWLRSDCSPTARHRRSSSFLALSHNQGYRSGFCTKLTAPSVISPQFNPGRNAGRGWNTFHDGILRCWPPHLFQYTPSMEKKIVLLLQWYPVNNQIPLAPIEAHCWILFCVQPKCTNFAQESGLSRQGPLRTTLSSSLPTGMLLSCPLNRLENSHIR